MMRLIFAAKSGYKGAMKSFVLLLAALSLSACAGSLTADQCNTDWRATGYADGEDGADVAKIGDYEAACERAGSPLSYAQRDAWLDGWGELQGVDARDVVVAQEDDYDYDYDYPRVRPSLGVGIGSRGVNVGAGVGVDFGAIGVGLYF